ncbi:DMT family transporter [Amycolatopsis plumensis]|uniref:DMT family transporter n=1 Tax=Amycolatopsis plumensis TaxID=236508 RepID=A0ABV5U5Y2_9PSEU
MKNDNSAIVGGREAIRPGLVLALLGVVSFSFTFPATTLALEGFGPWTVACGRSVVAGVVAAGCLAAGQVPVPDRRHWRGIAAVAGGCVLGFPLFTTWALRLSTTGHSAVVVGLLPLATAIVGARRDRRRRSRRFWLAVGAGAITVLAFTFSQSRGAPSTADLLLFAALGLCAFGYAEGGRLAAELPGWQVIAWALVLALPVTVPMTALALAHEDPRPSGAAVLGLAYVAIVSQFGGFIVWYRGMSYLGVTRASQLQLAQPLLTLVWSVLLLHETLPTVAPVTAVLVLLCIVITQRDRAGASPSHYEKL